MAEMMHYHDMRFLMFELDSLANELEKNGTKPIRMTLGKSELPLHDDIKNAMKQAIDDLGFNTRVHPTGLPELREKLARIHQEKYGKEISSEQVVIGPGSSFLYRCLFHLLARPGDRVLIPCPYYSLYKFCAVVAGAKIEMYDIDPRSGEIDWKAFEETIARKPALVVLNSPGNPYGNILSEQMYRQIDGIVDGCCPIISDETYNDIYFDEQPFSSLQIDSPRSNFIVTGSFSKGYRMYARRIGFFILPDRFVEPLSVTLEHSMLTTDPINQLAALIALDHPGEVEEVRHLCKLRNHYAQDTLQNFLLIDIFPSRGGFYLTIDCRRLLKERNFPNELELSRDILLKKHVAVVPGSDFGKPGHIRLSFTSERFMEGIDRLHAYFASKECTI